MSKFDSQNQPKNKNTFSSENQPSPKAKSDGWIRKHARDSLRGAMLNELAKITIDNGKEYTKAEKLIEDLVLQWDVYKDIKCFKLIVDISKQEGNNDNFNEEMDVIIDLDDDDDN